jgi:hypothetical protein
LEVAVFKGNAFRTNPFFTLDGIVVTLAASGVLINLLPVLNTILVNTTTATTATATCNYNINDATITTLKKWIVLESDPGEPLPHQEGIARLIRRKARLRRKKRRRSGIASIWKIIQPTRRTALTLGTQHQEYSMTR